MWLSEIEEHLRKLYGAAEIITVRDVEEDILRMARVIRELAEFGKEYIYNEGVNIYYYDDLSPDAKELLNG